jgi:SAM-dependent methyltransferase
VGRRGEAPLDPPYKTAMSFDALAPHYWWLERLAFGGRLQWCRTALLPHLTTHRRVLIVGDGDGRFLETFLKANPVAVVDSLDVSPGMVALARRRIGATDRVGFVVGDVRTDPLPGTGYDLIVTNFLLDCFPADQLAGVIGRLADICAPGGRWLVGDFAPPTAAWQRFALAAMYLFFRAATDLPAKRLADPSPLLAARGFVPVAEATRLGGFLAARLWGRG